MTTHHAHAAGTGPRLPATSLLVVGPPGGVR